MRSASSIAVLPVALVLLAGGACATRHSVESLQKQVARLQQDNFALRKELAEARVRLEMIREPGGAAAQQPSTASLGSAPAEGRAGEIASLDPPLPVAPVVYSEQITEARVYTGGAPQGPGAPPTGGRPAAGPSAAPAPGASAARTLLDAALGQLEARDPDAAIRSFGDIVATYPQDALADDAQFGVGEAYFQMGRFDEAIAEYRKVIELFPFGDRVPYAFLKIGFARLALEQRDLALDSFRTVSEAYPGTEAATVARQQIAHLARR